MKAVRQLSHALVHPMETVEEIKRGQTWRPWLACAILGLWFLITVIAEYATDFKFNRKNPEEINTLFLLGRTVGLYLLFIVVNWALTTLFDGKGTMKEIFCACSFALIPWMLSTLLNTALSRFLLIDENMFMIIIRDVGVIYAAFVFIQAMMAVHDYSFLKTVLSIAVSALGVLFVIFLVILFMGLAQQVIFFFRTIITEARMR